MEHQAPMRVAEWMLRRWRESGMSVTELSARSGVSKQTLYRLQQQPPGYEPSPATIRLLAGPLEYGKAAVSYLIPRAAKGESFRPDEYLDLVVEPIRRRPPKEQDGGSHGTS